MQDFIVSRTREFYILLVSEPVKYMFNEKKKSRDGDRYLQVRFLLYLYFIYYSTNKNLDIYYHIYQLDIHLLT